MTKSRKKAPHYKQLSRRKIVAYHEGGHAIAALDLGWPIKSATIRKSRNYDGMVIRAKQSSFEGDAKFLANMVIAAAGPFAQGRFAPDSGWGMELLGEVMDAACELGGEPPNRVFEVAEQTAKDLVERRWPAIERIAQMLLDRTKLSGAEIEAAVERDILTLDSIKAQTVPPTH
jgi:ATP-dependent Zn protease